MINEELRFLRDCIVESTLDDYENLEMLASEISAWATEENRPYSIELLQSGLQGLIGENVVQSFRYSQDLGKFVLADFDKNMLHELWFLAVSSHERVASNSKGSG